MTISLPGWDCPNCQCHNGSAKEWLPACRACGEPAPRPENKSRTQSIIAFARETWRNDGAEGETVHALCDALAQREEEVNELEVVLESERLAHNETRGYRAHEEALRKEAERKLAILTSYLGSE
jgi:hypothetical protein